MMIVCLLYALAPKQWLCPGARRGSRGSIHVIDDGGVPLI